MLVKAKDRSAQLRTTILPNPRYPPLPGSAPSENPCHAVVHLAAADQHENNLSPLFATFDVAIQIDGGLTEPPNC